jgi:hypothetical protein
MHVFWPLGAKQPANASFREPHDGISARAVKLKLVQAESQADTRPPEPKDLVDDFLHAEVCRGEQLAP